MKIRLLFLFFVIYFSIDSCVARSDLAETKLPLSELYSVLDRSIEESEQYIKMKERRLSVLRKQYADMDNLQARYELADGLYREYFSYSNDSALLWLGRGLELAGKLKRNDLVNDRRLLLANQYGISGFYNEAIFHFKQVPLTQLNRKQRINYYFVGSHFYGDLAFFSKDTQVEQQYYHIVDRYNDSLFAVAPKNSVPYLWRRTEKLNNDNHCQEALKTSYQWEQQVSYGTHDYAIMAFFRSEVYRKLGNRDEQKRWLTISALCDIRCAVMDQSSLWNLANLLSEDGDNDRAYRYMDFSWSSISHFSTHMRGWLVSPILTLINNNYRDSLRNANRHLVLLIVVVSLLSIFLLGIIIYVQRKRSQLAKARNELKVINNRLEILNDKLSNANTLLLSTNRQLSDANKMKDEYIGKFLSTCSEYVDKLDNYRIKVNRKLKAKQYNDLLNMTESEELKSNELAELFQNFDTVFLHLFPNFVNDFNALLRPEYRIQIPRGGQLTTDLRIFALIRLGIEESSRIAEFLNYSPNSIYNYRARIKNKALCDRDEFEKRVKEISM
ncbi:MAG: DUF6377 domain-containing protein [Prevotella sp.]|jgi:hypothetical protein